MAPRQYLGERARAMARDAIRAGRQGYHRAHIPTRTIYKAQAAQQTPKPTTIPQIPIRTTRSLLSINYPYRVGKATTRYVAFGVKNVMNMIGRNPGMALAAFGLMLVGKHLYRQRLRGQAAAAARSIIDAAGMYLDDQGEAVIRDNSKMARPRVDQKDQRRIQTREGLRSVPGTASAVEIKTSTRTRRVVTEADGSSPSISRVTRCVPPQQGRHVVERVRISPDSSTTYTSPLRGAGTEPSTLGSIRTSSPNTEIGDSDPSVSEVTQDQARRRGDLNARHAQYTERLARREAALSKRQTEWLEADEISTRAKELSDQAVAVSENALEAFDRSRGALFQTMRKLENAKSSRDLAKEKVDEIERQREELELEIHVDWE
ncbi:hypothetical protein FKW77_000594 [Venturia effusa]|uniref:Uncharacterized protein n=1 Tax=Venturia effusa TaxID=50376 RepID=A0A517LJK1_9PEZI|nr:hypothetical protein FKW77_000594 [Venturia effusa]